jgi:hypothetical protein
VLQRHDAARLVDVLDDAAVMAGAAALGADAAFGMATFGDICACVAAEAAASSAQAKSFEGCMSVAR